MPDSDCRDKHELENLTYTLEEVDNTNEKVTYNQLVREIHNLFLPTFQFHSHQICHSRIVLL